MPIDLVLGKPKTEPFLIMEDYVKRVEKLYAERYALVREHISRSAKHQKRTYDMRVRPQDFPLEPGYGFTVPDGLWADSRSGSVVKEVRTSHSRKYHVSLLSSRKVVVPNLS